MVTARQVINSIKSKPIKGPGPTQKGSAGYDNIRDDIEKTKKLREGSIEKVPVNGNDITNKTYVDDNFQPIDSVLSSLAALADAAGFLTNNGAGALSWGAAGSGDVTAGANLTDETLVQGDGGAKGVKTTTVTAAEVAANTGARHGVNDVNTSSAAAAHTHTHASTTGRTVNDHHAQVHALNSHTQGSNKIFMTKGAAFTEIGIGDSGKYLKSGGEDEDLTWGTPTGTYTDADAVTAAKADADIASAISLKHTQGTDTTLGTMTADIDMNGNDVKNLGGTSVKVSWDVSDAIAQFKCNDDVATTNVIDSSASANHGTASTNTSNLSVAGKINDAFDLVAATPEYVNIDAVQTDLHTSTQGTWCCWVNPDSIATNNTAILGFGDTNAVAYIALQQSPTDGRLRAGMGIVTARWVIDTNSAVLANGTWTHVCLVHNGTEPSLYANGQLIASTISVTTDKTAWFSDASGLDNGRIGCLNYNSLGNAVPFDGQVDDVRFFDRVLTADEILSLYNSGTGTEAESGSAEVAGVTGTGTTITVINGIVTAIS